MVKVGGSQVQSHSQENREFSGIHETLSKKKEEQEEEEKSDREEGRRGGRGRGSRTGKY